MPVHHQSRPSGREKYKKVHDALDAVRMGRCIELDEKHQAMSWEFLGVSDAASFWSAIEELLEELLSAGPAEHYAGSRPPQRSYEPAIQGLELWAYVWQSCRTGKKTYLKFAIKTRKQKKKTRKEDEGHWLFFVDCHEDDPK